MELPRWYYFYDFHTMPACPDVATRFDAGSFAEDLRESGVDYVVFPARCNLGMAYYDTAVGIRHPSMERDLLGELVAACHQRGVRFCAYFNVGLSHEEGLRHRDWLAVTPEGYTYKPDRLDHFFRTMCYNTSYGPHVLEMVREVVEGYGVDGLFLDCMAVSPCVGVECVREMKQRGVDWRDADALAEFANFSRVRMARRIAEGALAVRADVLLYFNGVRYEDQLDFCTHLEFECLPTCSLWGYELLPVHGRYLRTLGKPVYNMTGRFHGGWGDFGGVRPEASLAFDCARGLAYGMRACIGDHMHPRGDVNRAAEGVKRRVFERLRPLEPWVDGAVAEAEVAVATPKGLWREDVLKGAARVLGELRVQFDVITEHSRPRDYRVLVLPDYVLLDAAWAARLREHLARGGGVLASGASGLDGQRKGLALEEWGVRYVGDEPCDPAYIQVGPRLADGMPPMPITLYEKGLAVEAAEGAEVLAQIVAPYYNRQWDGEHGFVYLPPDKPTGRPAATVCGNVVYLSHPIFEIYHKHAAPAMRQLVGNALAILLPRPMVRAENLPSFGRVTVTSQPGRRMLHVLTYVPERRGPAMDVVEEPIAAHDVRLGLRLDGEAVSRAYVAPFGRDVAVETLDGYAWATLPVVRGHAVVVMETARPARSP
jgi:hypothetical protein